MNFVEFTKMFGKMHELMIEPAWVFSNEAVARTETETATFLWDSADADSNVVLTRDTEYDAANLPVSSTAWSVTNAPTVTGVTTDQTINTEVSLSGTTVLTITGTNYGAADADLEVYLAVQRRGSVNGPHPGSRADGRILVKATVTAVNVGDTEITASIVLPNQYGGLIAAAGVCEVQVRNVKRHLKSALWTGLTVA
jgi:hypothetical protein